jgi:hypothetical protein
MVTDKLNLKTKTSLKIKDKFFIITLFLLFTYIGNAQISLSGKVITSENKPLELAEVVLLTKDSVAIKSELTDGNGYFNLKANPGKYKIQIRQIGKLLFYKEIEAVRNTDLGDIIVVLNENVLKEITVVARKKLIERKVDRLVFNVENSISAAGGDALDALKITPSIRVQNDKISLIGKSSLAVMIDDKLIQLSGDDLINFLKTISSDNIKNIEVITTPPAKYSAEGTSGLINIKLKKVKKDSWSTTVRSRSTQATNFSQSVGVNYMYQKNKLDYSTDISYGNGNYFDTNSPKSYFSNETWNQEDRIKNNSKTITGNFIINYQLTPKTKIGAFYNDFTRNAIDYQSNENLIYSKETTNLYKYYYSKGTTAINSFNRALNFNLIHKIDTLGKKISLDIDYFKRYESKENPFYTTNENYVTHSNNNYYTFNIGEQKINNFSTNLDFEMPYKWANLNYGAKISFTKTNNDVLGNFYEVIEGLNRPYINQFNDFKYIENNQAIYFSAQKKFNKKWNTKFGLRIESTQTEGTSNPENQINKKNYIKLFPTAYISYSLDDNNNFSLNYSRRIQRPAFWELNPAKWYTNLNFINYGNPFLQPSFSHNFELNYNYKNRLNTGFWLSKTDGESGQLTINQNENIILSIRENFANTLSAGCTEYFYFTPYTWWSITSTLNIYYASNNTISPYLNAQYSGWGGDLNITDTFNLNTSKSLSAEIIYNYDFPNKYAYDTRQGRTNLDIGLKYNMLYKKLKFNLFFSDLLGSYKTIGTRNTQGILYTFNIYNDTRSVRFSINYTFGNNTIKIDKREGGNADERKRSN